MAQRLVDAKGRRIPQPQWYNTLHKWVQRHGKKPDACTKCGVIGKRLEWANISGEYKRDLTDFVALCNPCHALLDKRAGVCRKGHDMKGDKAYVRPATGARSCRRCDKARKKLYRERSINGQKASTSTSPSR